MPPAKAGCPRTFIKGVGTDLLSHTQWCRQRLPKVLGKPVVHTLPNQNNPSLRSGPFEPVKTHLTEVRGRRVGISLRLERSLLLEVFTVAKLMQEVT